MVKITAGLQPSRRKEWFAIVFQCVIHHQGINQAHVRWSEKTFDAYGGVGLGGGNKPTRNPNQPNKQNHPQKENSFTL